MKKIKKIFAVLGLVVLVGLYGTTLVSAIFVTPATKKFFMASLLATIMIPILLYIYIWLYRLIKGDEEEETAPKDNGFQEAFKDK